MSPRLFQDFRDGYIRLSSLTVEHSIVVVAQDESILNPMGGQFSILVFIKFVKDFTFECNIPEQLNLVYCH